MCMLPHIVSDGPFFPRGSMRVIPCGCSARVLWHGNFLQRPPTSSMTAPDPHSRVS